MDKNKQTKIIEAQLVVAETKVLSEADMQEQFGLMDPTHRRILMHLLNGQMPFEAIVNAGCPWVLEEVKPFYSTVLSKDLKSTAHRNKTGSLRPDNVNKISQVDMDKFQALSTEWVKQNYPGMNIGKMTQQVTPSMMLQAPDAFDVVAQILRGELNGNKVTPGTSLKAALEILDRTGHGAQTRESAKQLPVTVNIVMPGQPKQVFQIEEADGQNSTDED